MAVFLGGWMKNNVLFVLLASYLLVFTVNCGGGGGEDGSDFGTTSLECIEGGTCRVFISKATSTGDLDVLGDNNGNGVFEADALCNADTNKPNNSLYKAMLVSSGTRHACVSNNCTTNGLAEHVDWVVKPNTKYIRVVDNAVISTSNAFGLFDFPLENSFDDNNENVWTGLSGDWRIENSCNNWTSDDSESGASGVTDEIGSKSIRELLFCSTSSTRLYCVEQGLPPSVQSCDNNPFCRVFLTARTVTGDLDNLPGFGDNNGNGVREADILCNVDANKPNDESVYKAIIVDGAGERRACSTPTCTSGGSLENIDWALKAGKAYQNLNGDLVFTTNSKGIFSSLTNKLTLVSEDYWTGLAINWTPKIDLSPVIAPLDCQNWSSSDLADRGGVGDKDNIHSDFWAHSNRGCTSQYNLLCAEQ